MIHKHIDDNKTTSRECGKILARFGISVPKKDTLVSVFDVADVLLGLEKEARKAKENVKTTAYVSQKHWGPGDDYLVIETQVFSEDGFKPGDEVELTIRKEPE